MSLSATLTRHSHDLAGFVRNFGTVHGLKAYIRNLLDRRAVAQQPRLLSLKPRSLSSKIVHRSGTSDFDVLKQIIIDTEYEVPSAIYQRVIEAEYCRMLERGLIPIIVDCGANIGLSAVWFANRYPEAFVVAIEPEPGNFSVLSRNVEGNPRIIPVRAAASDQNKTVRLLAGSGGDYSWQTGEDEAGDTPAITVPGAFALVPNGAPLIVKIDIEGFETTLFRSHTEWADTVPLIIYEAHDWLFNWRGTEHAIVRTLSRTPRDYLRAGENTFAFSHALKVLN